MTDAVRSGYSRSREGAVADRFGAGGEGFRSTLQNTLETVQRRDARGEGEQQRLMNACVEMESLFVSRMLSEMRKTVHRSDWLYGGFAEDVFTDMLYDEYALQISKNSNLGLARQLYEEMSRSMR
ncbi:MAG: rod-binding protein [Spirochaetes bacterium]|nr:rod-binding protein [Spirochaetota bacterium]